MQLFLGFAVVEGNLVFLAVAAHAHRYMGGKRVHNRNAHAVQAAGDLVAFAAELATRVQDGKNNLYGRNLLFRMQVNRDTAAVVHNRDGVVLVNGNFDMVAVAGKRFVYRVVHNLVHQVMKATRAGRADIHARALAHRFKAFQDLDVLATVMGFFRSHVFLLFLLIDAPNRGVSRLFLTF